MVWYKYGMCCSHGHWVWAGYRLAETTVQYAKHTYSRSPTLLSHHTHAVL